MSRRELREHVFRLLFHYSFYSSEEMNEEIDLYLDDALGFHDDDDADAQLHAALSSLTDEEKEAIANRVKAILKLVPELDKELEDKTQSWKLNRMSKVDLTIMRLAVYEMEYDELVPVKVAINEAVELGKKYGGDESSRFINGVLAKMVKAE